VAFAATILSSDPAAAVEVVGETAAIYRDLQQCEHQRRTAIEGLKLLAYRIGWADFEIFKSGAVGPLQVLVSYRVNDRSVSVIFECDDKDEVHTKYLLNSG
jgi:hypothetical protein